MPRDLGIPSIYNLFQTQTRLKLWVISYNANMKKRNISLIECSTLQRNAKSPPFNLRSFSHGLSLAQERPMIPINIGIVTSIRSKGR